MRGLSDDFLIDLKLCKLKNLLSAVKEDDTLCLEIRDNHLNEMEKSLKQRGGNKMMTNFENDSSLNDSGHEKEEPVYGTLDKKYDDFYQQLRKKMKRWLRSKNGRGNKWADYLMFAPDLFHLLVRLMFDNEVSTKDKSILAAVVAYFISPIDLIPEAITGMFGYMDDIALSALALNGLVNRTDETLVRKYWAGDQDVLDTIRQILEIADNMLGSEMWKRLKNMNLHKDKI